MSDKSVIIDGVDVSGCEYYSKKQQIYSATKPLCKMKDCCMLSDSVSLCLEKNCYYKQLKRLEQENEELKQDLHEVENACSCFESENADLRKENERLKEENKELSESIKRLKNMAKAAALGREKYKYALQELEKENERLKEECTLYDCGNKEWAIEYKKLKDDYTELNDTLDDISYDKSNYYQALQEIKEIIDFRFKTSYMTLGFKEYDELIEDIDKIVNEVIGAEE